MLYSIAFLNYLFLAAGCTLFKYAKGPLGIRFSTDHCDFWIFPVWWSTRIWPAIFELIGNMTQTGKHLTVFSETGTLALIMDDVGSSIRYGVRVPEEQRYVLKSPLFSLNDCCLHRTTFIHAMTSIHRAGIRHLDLWPNNLLINEKGETFIIDFDRAQLNPRPQAMSHESACLKYFLDGKEDGYFYSPQANSYCSESD